MGVGLAEKFLSGISRMKDFVPISAVHNILELRIMWRKCVICGREFLGTSTSKACTPRCLKIHKENYGYKYRRENREKMTDYQHEYYLRKKVERLKNENHGK